jgi:hypothetical protein
VRSLFPPEPATQISDFRYGCDGMALVQCGYRGKKKFLSHERSEWICRGLGAKPELGLYKTKTRAELKIGDGDAKANQASVYQNSHIKFFTTMKKKYHNFTGVSKIREKKTINPTRSTPTEVKLYFHPYSQYTSRFKP